MEKIIGIFSYTQSLTLKATVPIFLKWQNCWGYLSGVGQRKLLEYHRLSWTKLSNFLIILLVDYGFIKKLYSVNYFVFNFWISSQYYISIYLQVQVMVQWSQTYFKKKLEFKASRILLKEIWLNFESPNFHLWKLSQEEQYWY